MKRKIVSILLMLSLVSYVNANNSIREIEPLFEADKNSVSQEISNSFQTSSSTEIQNKIQQPEVNQIYEYRPETLREIDKKIAVPANRGILKSLNAEYDKELLNYLESINYDSERIFFMANQYMMMNNYSKANKIFILDSRDLKNVFGAATTYRFMGKNMEAIQKYNEAISINSSFSESYLGRALANRNLDNYESAINDLKKYISMTSSMEGYAALGDIYFKLGRKKDAYDIVASGLNRYPDSELLKKLINGISKSGEEN